MSDVTNSHKTDPILTWSEVLKIVPYSRVQVWRMVRAGSFPPPLQLSERRIGWRQSVVEEWINSREAVAWAPAPAEL